MTNISGTLEPGIYQGGNAKKFTEDLDIRGDEILYIGDHIYGDILRLKKDCNWRTALVVEELGEEIAAQKKALPIERDIVSSMNVKKDLERKFADLYTQSKDEATNKYDHKMEQMHNEITALDTQISKLLQEQNAYFNPKWGRVFRAGAEESFFANQVDRFACIYMEQLSDFFTQSPITYFRANIRALAHDIPI
jgi:hypothetical protein